MKRISIAIDGPAGAGKSTIAKIISKKLNIIYLDTGAMYRTVALKAINTGIDTKDPIKLEKIINDIDIKIEFLKSGQHIYLDNEDVTGCIRTAEVTRGSSDVAVVPEVRKKMVELQRKIAADNSIVMDGRDIGTYVIPQAEFKFFLTASIEERANRRYREQLEKGIDTTYEEVLKDISYRDKNDSSRRLAPLKKADDAVEIDTTYLTIGQVADKIISVIEEKDV